MQTPTNAHAVAHNLRGFRSSTLRVRVLRSEGNNVWVVTADLLDTGTPLTLDASQVETEVPETAPIHRDGLVAFAA